LVGAMTAFAATRLGDVRLMAPSLLIVADHPFRNTVYWV
jgi:hypothetical protein